MSSSSQERTGCGAEGGAGGMNVGNEPGNGRRSQALESRPAGGGQRASVIHEHGVVTRSPRPSSRGSLTHDSPQARLHRGPTNHDRDAGYVGRNVPRSDHSAHDLGSTSNLDLQYMETRGERARAARTRAPRGSGDVDAASEHHQHHFQHHVHESDHHDESDHARQPRTSRSSTNFDFAEDSILGQMWNAPALIARWKSKRRRQSCSSYSHLGGTSSHVPSPQPSTVFDMKEGSRGGATAVARSCQWSDCGSTTHGQHEQPQPHHAAQHHSHSHHLHHPPSHARWTPSLAAVESGAVAVPPGETPESEIEPLLGCGGRTWPQTHTAGSGCPRTDSGNISPGGRRPPPGEELSHMLNAKNPLLTEQQNKEINAPASPSSFPARLYPALPSPGHLKTRTSTSWSGLSHRYWFSRTRASSVAASSKMAATAGPRSDGKMRCFAVAALAFFSVSGGPFGVEETFRFSPMLGVSALAFVAFFWGWAQCQWMSELSCMMPRDGGNVIWVKRAFGDGWGWQMAYWGRVTASFGSALYVVLLVDSIQLTLLPTLLSGGEQYGGGEAPGAGALPDPADLNWWCKPVAGRLMRVAVVIILAIPALFSSKTYDRILEWMCGIAMLCFMVFVVYVIGFYSGGDVLGGAPPTQALVQTHGFLQTISAGGAIPQNGIGGSEEATPALPLQGAASASKGALVVRSQSAPQDPAMSEQGQPATVGDLQKDDQQPPPHVQHDVEPPKRGRKSWKTLLEPPPANYHWLSDTSDLLLFSYWGLSGWDNVSSMAEEIHRPEVTLPKALSIACVATWAQYALIFSAVAITNVEPWQNWGEPEKDDPADKSVPLVKLLERIVLPAEAQDDKHHHHGEGPPVVSARGRTSNMARTSSRTSQKGASPLRGKRSYSAGTHVLKVIITLVMVCGFVAPYASELLGGAHQIPGLVEDGMLPQWKIFSYRHPKFQTPWAGIFWHTLIVCALVMLDFKLLQIFDSMFNVLPDLAGLLAFWKIRWDTPLVQRPEKGKGKEKEQVEPASTVPISVRHPTTIEVDVDVDETLVGNKLEAGEADQVAPDARRQQAAIEDRQRKQPALQAAMLVDDEVAVRMLEKALSSYADQQLRGAGEARKSSSCVALQLLHQGEQEAERDAVKSTHQTTSKTGQSTAASSSSSPPAAQQLESQVQHPVRKEEEATLAAVSEAVNVNASVTVVSVKHRMNLKNRSASTQQEQASSAMSSSPLEDEEDGVEELVLLGGTPRPSRQSGSLKGDVDFSVIVTDGADNAVNLTPAHHHHHEVTAGGHQNQNQKQNENENENDRMRLQAARLHLPHLQQGRPSQADEEDEQEADMGLDQVGDHAITNYEHDPADLLRNDFKDHPVRDQDELLYEQKDKRRGSCGSGKMSLAGTHLSDIPETDEEVQLGDLEDTDHHEDSRFSEDFRPFIVPKWVAYGVFPISFLFGVIILFITVLQRYLQKNEYASVIVFVVGVGGGLLVQLICHLVAVGKMTFAFGGAEYM